MTEQRPDTYTWRARITPAAITGSPGLAFMVAGGVNLDAKSGILSLLVGAAGVIAAGVARDAGYRLQPSLWNSWGGSPTVRKLRWRESTNPALLRRLHDDVALVVGNPLPTSEREAQDPAGADAEYEAAIAVLRQRTGDTKTFNKLFAENMEYGFRRNCLGLRPTGLVLAAVGVIASLALTIWGVESVATRVLIWGWPGLVSLAALAFWARIVTPAWVRRPAETYADRLLESVHTLKRQGPANST